MAAFDDGIVALGAPDATHARDSLAAESLIWNPRLTSLADDDTAADV